MAEYFSVWDLISWIKIKHDITVWDHMRYRQTVHHGCKGIIVLCTNFFYYRIDIIIKDLFLSRELFMLLLATRAGKLLLQLMIVAVVSIQECTGSTKGPHVMSGRNGRSSLLFVHRHSSHCASRSRIMACRQGAVTVVCLVQVVQSHEKQELTWTQSFKLVLKISNLYCILCQNIQVCRWRHCSMRHCVQYCQNSYSIIKHIIILLCRCFKNWLSYWAPKLRKSRYLLWKKTASYKITNVHSRKWQKNVNLSSIVQSSY
jgi:hypothetical protein